MSLLIKCRLCHQSVGENGFYRDARRRSGRASRCIECCKSKAKRDYVARGGAAYSREQARKWREANPRRNKHLKLKHAFGIGIDDYESMLSRQGGGCAICRAEPDGGAHLCVDHDHATGRVRGLLCHACNKGVGFFRDHPDLLGRAAEYLKPDIFAATYEPAE